MQPTRPSSLQSSNCFSPLSASGPSSGVGMSKAVGGTACGPPVSPDPTRMPMFGRAAKARARDVGGPGCVASPTRVPANHAKQSCRDGISKPCASARFFKHRVLPEWGPWPPACMWRARNPHGAGALRAQASKAAKNNRGCLQRGRRPHEHGTRGLLRTQRRGIVWPPCPPRSRNCKSGRCKQHVQATHPTSNILLPPNRGRGAISLVSGEHVNPLEVSKAARQNRWGRRALLAADARHAWRKGGR